MMHFKEITLGTLLIITGIFFTPFVTNARVIRPDDINKPDGIKIEATVTDLSAPTMVAFDDEDRMLIAESGYGDAGVPKITRIEKGGAKTVLVEGAAFGKNLPVTAVAFYNGAIYTAHGGAISIVEQNKTLRTIITGMPGLGDHQINQIGFKNGVMYFGVGTVTNSGVVGPDNAVFGWLKDNNLKNVHDIACQDITLNNIKFSSNDPFNLGKTVETSAYSSYGQTLKEETIIKGDIKCNGALMQANPDGSDLSVYAWGFRNPYGLDFGPDGKVYVTMHGFDARGSRPIENAWDCFYAVEKSAWYGWPDFACDTPITDARFKPENKSQPTFLMKDHPTETPPKPIAKFTPHAAANGFGFSNSAKFGSSSIAYIALFGDFTPATGTVNEPQGVQIVRVDTETGQITSFISNKIEGLASKHSAGGLEHPSDVTFGPDGAMYVADWGIADVSTEGLKLEKDSGVIWKITAQDSAQADSANGSISNFPGGPSSLLNILLIIVLGVLTMVTLWTRNPNKSIKDGAFFGALSGVGLALVMTILALLVKLPWYAPARLLSTMVIGRSGIDNILEFELSSFLLGLLLLLIITTLLGSIFAYILKTNKHMRIVVGAVLFGLTIWALMQYLIWPIIAPLITEKGFRPELYALSFALFGLFLGLLFVYGAPLIHKKRLESESK